MQLSSTFNMSKAKASVHLYTIDAKLKLKQHSKHNLQIMYAKTQ